jgi:catechol 2,3-dioxygenase-like lactoylglutathione lyase family enzyme
MFKKRVCAVQVMIMLSPVARAAEPGTAPVPAAVVALNGCWDGRGEVMGKAVTMAIAAKPIVQDALLAVDAESRAVADDKDRYSAHLIFGGANKAPGATADPIVGFWADSFGGAFTTLGRGESRSGGFDIAYQYPDNAFVNRWRVDGNRLTWQIVARNGKGVEKPFASYALRKAACPPAKDS